MKLLTILFAAIGIFFLTSCSDVNQDMSPVAPGVDKVVMDPGPISPFIYSYLQSFSRYPVSDYYLGKGVNKVTIELGGDVAISEIVHAFAIFDYDSQVLPEKSKLVFLGKPSSSTIEVPGVASTSLSGVRVYYLGSSSGTPVSGAYSEFQNFTEISASSKIQEKLITLSSSAWNPDIAEAFAEVQFKEGGQLVFLEKPSASNFSFPYAYGNQVKGVKLFGLFNN
jgi:hypothetical protein